MPLSSDSSPESTVMLTGLRHVLASCERFESEWRSGTRPTIEAYLASTPEGLRTEAMSLLLRLEVALRREAGESPSAEEYRARLPGWTAIVDTVLGTPAAGLGGVGEPPSTEPPADSTAPAEGETVGDSGPSLGSTEPGFDGQAAGSADDGCGQSGPRFRKRTLLDGGGLGLIYLADDRELNREVALKEMRGELMSDADSMDRFIREAAITGQLEHPGIVPVYGFGHQPDGRPYYAMRLIRGTDGGQSQVTVRLEDEIRGLHQAPAPVGDAPDFALRQRRLLQAFVRICQTVAYAHGRKVIHRDLKPSNILLGPHGEVLVVDWGVARIFEGPNASDSGTPAGSPPPRLPEELPTTVTEAGDVVGTLAYMPPEQAAGEISSLGPASDIYSLGAVLYEILTDRPPFRRDGRDLETVRREVIQGKFSSPRQVRREVSPSLEAMCLKSMSRDPADRYPSALALADDIDRWLADEPVSAHRDGAATNLRRWARGHKPLLAGIAALLLAGVIGLLADIWVIARERDRADKGLDLAATALHDILGIIATDLGYVEGSARIRQRAAAKAKDAYDQLVELQPHQPKTLLVAADAYRKLGNVYRMTGDDPQARDFYRKSDEALAKVPARDSTLEGRAVGIASGFVESAEVHRMRGRMRLAEQELDNALLLLSPIRTINSRNYRLVTALIHLNRSALKLENGEPSAARELADRAIGLFGSLGSPLPLDQEKLLLGARINRGVAQRELGEFASARQGLQEVLDRLAELRRGVPAQEQDRDPDLAFFSGTVEEELAEAQARSGDRETRSLAAERFTSAIETLERLVEKNRELALFRRELAVARYRRGAVLMPDARKAAAKDLQLAVDDLERLNREQRGIPDTLGQLARARNHLAELADREGEGEKSRALRQEAIRLLDEAIGINPDNRLDRALRDQIRP